MSELLLKLHGLLVAKILHVTTWKWKKAEHFNFLL